MDGSLQLRSIGNNKNCTCFVGQPEKEQIGHPVGLAWFIYWNISRPFVLRLPGVLRINIACICSYFNTLLLVEFIGWYLDNHLAQLYGIDFKICLLWIWKMWFERFVHPLAYVDPWPSRLVTSRQKGWIEKAAETIQASLRAGLVLDPLKERFLPQGAYNL